VLHRLTKEQYPDAGNPKTQYFEYKYDNAGRRIEMTDPTYARAAVEPKPQRWAYDQDGMLINVGHSQNVDYLRNRGEDYGVMYDSRGRINRVLYPGDNNQPVMEVEYQYNDANQIAKIIARDLTKGASTDIYCMEYGYDANGRKIRQVVKEQEADEDTDAYYVTTFNYDSRDMLTDEKYLRWDNANTIWKVMYWGHYNYDTAGNMVNRVVSQIVNGVAKMYIDGPFTYSRGYQLRYFNRTDPGNAETRAYNLTYDANGNVTHIQRQQGQQPFTDSFYEITEMEFDYDAKNRLVKYRFGGAGSWYDIKYDALGRVRERVDLTPTTSKYYLDGRQLIQQLDSYNNVQFDYLRGATGLDRQWNETNDTRRFYIKDNLGTVWAVVNPSDLSVKRYNYNAWGEHLDKDDTDFPTDTNWMRYIGCRVEAFGKGTTTQRDAIYHLDFRDYLPITQCFLNRDPLTLKDINSWKLPSGLYSYVYSLNDPSNRSDVLGLHPNTTRWCEWFAEVPVDYPYKELHIVWYNQSKKLWCVWFCSFTDIQWIYKTYDGNPGEKSEQVGWIEDHEYTLVPFNKYPLTFELVSFVKGSHLLWKRVLVNDGKDIGTFRLDCKLDTKYKYWGNIHDCMPPGYTEKDSSWAGGGSFSIIWNQPCQEKSPSGAGWGTGNGSCGAPREKRFDPGRSSFARAYGYPEFKPFPFEGP